MTERTYPHAKELMECDWLTTPDGRLLHYAEGFDEEVWEREGVWIGQAACGVRGRFIIPGIFTRMGEKRCDRCCDRLGYPRGKGSPKNDAACHARLTERTGWRSATPTTEDARASTDETPDTPSVG